MEPTFFSDPCSLEVTLPNLKHLLLCVLHSFPLCLIILEHVSKTKSYSVHEQHSSSVHMIYGRDKYADKPLRKRNNGRIQVVTGLRSIKDSFKKILLVNRFLPRFYYDDGILTLGAFDFLLNDDALERF